jgi:hypothetical protein
MTYVGALSSATAVRAIQEVLLQTVADASSEFGAGTRQRAAELVASVGIIALSIRAHERLALLVARGTLTARALQPIASTAAGAVLRSLIGWAGR